MMTDEQHREIALDAEIAKAVTWYDGIWRSSWEQLEADLRAGGWDEETISLSLEQSFQTYTTDRAKYVGGLRAKLSGSPDADVSHGKHLTERKAHDRG